jgi:hypothetical protein
MNQYFSKLIQKKIQINKTIPWTNVLDLTLEDDRNQKMTLKEDDRYGRSDQRMLRKLIFKYLGHCPWRLSSIEAVFKLSPLLFWFGPLSWLLRKLIFIVCVVVGWLHTKSLELNGR